MRGKSRVRLCLGRVAHRGNVGEIGTVGAAVVRRFCAGLLARHFIRGLLRCHRSHQATLLLGKDRARRKDTPGTQSSQEVMPHPTALFGDLLPKVKSLFSVSLIAVNTPGESPIQVC
jgi:hypothetical protein